MSILHNVRELIEEDSIFRYSALPIKDQSSWDARKKAEEQFWVAEEVDKELAKDPKDWKALDDKIKKPILTILALFGVADGYVGEFISEQILSRVKMREAIMWYNFKNAMEDIHNVVYSKLIETYTESVQERDRLLNSVEHFPVIKRKIAWINRWAGTDNDIWNLSDDTKRALHILADGHKNLMETVARAGGLLPVNSAVDTLLKKLTQPRVPLARVIFMEAVLEGLFFSASFCIIFWINHQYGILPGLTKANEFISRDEGWHTIYDIMLYNQHIKHRLTQSEAHQIIAEAVEIEADFAADALPTGLPGMNSTLMLQYVQFVADQLLAELKYDRLFKVTNPFDFMDKQSVSVRMSDFFMDANVSEYGHHSSGLSVEDHSVNFDEDF